MDRPTVVIISDEPEFSASLTRRWLAERSVPSFTLTESSAARDFTVGHFDLAIIGGVAPAALGTVLDALNFGGKSVIHVARAGASTPSELIAIPEIQGWQDFVITLAAQIFECARAQAELGRLAEKTVHLEHQAALGRYILDVRHNLNNALTSILGNSDLILLDPALLQPAQRTQVETIRNMAMRLNEIMQRFSSLQKEMQLVEQGKKQAKAATVGA